MRGQIPVARPEHVHLDRVCIPRAEHLFVLFRVLVEHEGADLQRERVLHEAINVISSVPLLLLRFVVCPQRIRLSGHLSHGRSSEVAFLYPVCVKYPRVQKLDELIELVIEQLFFILDEQDEAEREERLDATRKYVVEYSEDDIHGETVHRQLYTGDLRTKRTYR